jgi:hypothetical protein
MDQNEHQNGSACWSCHALETTYDTDDWAFWGLRHDQSRLGAASSNYDPNLTPKIISAIIIE